jgi:hypothetical protein
MSTTVEVILCVACKGNGHIYTDVLTCYHKREYDTHISECKNCKGTGRILKTTVVTYDAYKP